MKRPDPASAYTWACVAVSRSPACGSRRGSSRMTRGELMIVACSSRSIASPSRGVGAAEGQRRVVAVEHGDGSAGAGDPRGLREHRERVADVADEGVGDDGVEARGGEVERVRVADGELDAVADALLGGEPPRGGDEAAGSGRRPSRCRRTRRARRSRAPRRRCRSRGPGPPPRAAGRSARGTRRGRPRTSDRWPRNSSRSTNRSSVASSCSLTNCIASRGCACVAIVCSLGWLASEGRDVRVHDGDFRRPR